MPKRISLMSLIRSRPSLATTCRIVALFFLTVGVYGSFVDPLRFPALDLGGVLVSWPPLAILVGLLGIAYPLHWLWVVVTVLGKRGAKLRHFLVSLHPATKALSRPRDAATTDLTETVRAFLDNATVTTIKNVLLTFSIGLTLILLFGDPAAAKRSIEDTAWDLASIVHQYGVDYSEHGTYSETLRAAAPLASCTFPEARSLYMTLRDLFPEQEPATAAATHTQAKAVLYQRIESVLARKVSANLSRCEASCRIALFSILASVANEQSDQASGSLAVGRASRVLDAVAPLATTSHETYRFFLNVSGVAFSHRFKCAIRSSPEDHQARAQALPLAMAAHAAFEQARLGNCSPTIFARCTNNLADLSLDLVANQLLHNTGALRGEDLEQREFIERFTADLDVTFSNTESALRTAINVMPSRKPELFFTVGQVLSLASALADRHVHCPSCEWRDARGLACRAVQSLEVARGLELPARLFTEARARDFYLDKCWTYPDLRQRLEELAR